MEIQLGPGFLSLVAAYWPSVKCAQGQHRVFASGDTKSGSEE